MSAWWVLDSAIWCWCSPPPVTITSNKLTSNNFGLGVRWYWYVFASNFLNNFDFDVIYIVLKALDLHFWMVVCNCISYQWHKCECWMHPAPSSIYLAPVSDGSDTSARWIWHLSGTSVGSFQHSYSTIWYSCSHLYLRPTPFASGTTSHLRGTYRT